MSKNLEITMALCPKMIVLFIYYLLLKKNIEKVPF